MTGSVPDARVQSLATDRLGSRSILVVFFAVLIVHCMSPSVQVTDSRLSVPVADQVIRHHSLDLSHASQVTSLPFKYDVIERHGRLLPFFPWPPMLFAIPGTVVATAVGKDAATLRPSSPNQTWIVEVPTASLLVALTAVILALVTFDVVGGPLGRRRRMAVVVALVYAFATGAWSTGSRALSQHTLSMLFLSFVLLCAIRLAHGHRWAVMLGMSLGVAYEMRPTNAVVVVCFAVWLLSATGLLSSECLSVWRS